MRVVSRIRPDLSDAAENPFDLDFDHNPPRIWPRTAVASPVALFGVGDRVWRTIDPSGTLQREPARAVDLTQRRSSVSLDVADLLGVVARYYSGDSGRWVVRKPDRDKV